jgi:hypothetical protein
MVQIDPHHIPNFFIKGSSSQWWAARTFLSPNSIKTHFVDGQYESLTLVKVVDSQPHSTEQLEAVVTIGSTFEVLYNLAITCSIVQDGALRVFAFTDD